MQEKYVLFKMLIIYLLTSFHHWKVKSGRNIISKQWLYIYLRERRFSNASQLQKSKKLQEIKKIFDGNPMDLLSVRTENRSMMIQQ